MSFDDFAWLPLCGGLTAVGIVLSYFAFRRRGAAAGLRMTAWSLLPLAAYLTGALRTLWNIGSSAVGFVTGLVLSPAVWAGVVLAGLSVLLFFVSGALRGRALSRVRGGSRTAGSAEAGASEQVAKDTTPTRAMKRPAKESAPAVAAAPAKPAKPAKQDAADDFSDIEAILKKRGIS